jgi:hypothetical protein
MSYADTMSETDEIRAYEEGRLQGLKDIWKLAWFHNANSHLMREINKLVDEQQEFVDSTFGDVESE